MALFMVGSTACTVIFSNLVASSRACADTCTEAEAIGISKSQQQGAVVSQFCYIVMLLSAGEVCVVVVHAAPRAVTYQLASMIPDVLTLMLTRTPSRKCRSPAISNRPSRRFSYARREGPSMMLHTQITSLYQRSDRATTLDTTALLVPSGAGK